LGGINPLALNQPDLAWINRVNRVSYGPSKYRIARAAREKKQTKMKQSGNWWTAVESVGLDCGFNSASPYGWCRIQSNVRESERH
jgi:hypothetical protein